MSWNTRTHLGNILIHRQPAMDQLCEENLQKIERQGVKESRSAQHKVLLKLATYSHGRHVRENKLETMTRLFASDGIKTKRKSSDKANRKYNKHGQSNKIQKTTIIQNEEFVNGHKADERRGSLESEGSLKSGASHKAESVRFSESEIRLPRRTRALSVDLLVNPIITARRRQSAPEVIITPAKLQQLPESSLLISQKSSDEVQEIDHLSPSYSVTTEFFEDDHPEDLLKTKLPVNKNTRQGSIPKSEGEDGTASVSSSASRLKAGSSKTGGIGAKSKMSLGSRKISRSSSRRRASHLPPKTETSVEEIQPLKDPRYLNLIAELKEVKIQKIQTNSIPKDEETNLAGTNESGKPLGVLKLKAIQQQESILYAIDSSESSIDRFSKSPSIVSSSSKTSSVRPE